MDDDLALALVGPESGGNPYANSGKAQGMFQVTPANMQKFAPGESPYDPVANAKAALSLLDEEWDRFGGDIPSVIAAYNAGGPAVQRAIAAAGSHNFDDYQKHLPQETRNYVPKVLAAYQNLKAQKQQEAAKMYAPDEAIDPGSVGISSEFANGVRDILTGQDVASTSVPSLVQKIGQLYNSKRWTSETDRMMKSVTQALWTHADPKDIPDWSKLAGGFGALVQGEDPKDIGTAAADARDRFRKTLLSNGIHPDLYGNQIDDYFAAVQKEQTERAAVRNRGVLGTAGRVGAEVLKSAADFPAAIASFASNVAGAPETAEAISNYPEKLFGHTREFEYETNPDGSIKFDDFGQPITRYRGSILRGLSMLLPIMGEGKALEAMAFAPSTVSTLMGGSNAMFGADLAYKEARANGATHGEGLLAGFLSMPIAGLAGAAEHAALGTGDAWVTGLNGTNQARAMLQIGASSALKAGLANVAFDTSIATAAGAVVGKAPDMSLQRTALAFGGGAVAGGLMGGISGYDYVPQEVVDKLNGKQSPVTPEAKPGTEKPSPQNFTFRPAPPDMLHEPGASGLIGLPAPAVEVRPGLPAPEQPTALGYNQAPRIDQGEMFPALGEPSSAYSLPDRTRTDANGIPLPAPLSAEKQQSLARNLAAFKASHEAEFKSDVPAEQIPPGLLSVLGMEATNGVDGKALITRRSAYTPDEIDESDPAAVTSQISKLQREVLQGPPDSQLGALYAERRDLWSNLADFFKESKTDPNTFMKLVRDRSQIESEITSNQERARNATDAQKTQLDLDLGELQRKWEAVNKKLSKTDDSAAASQQAARVLEINGQAKLLGPITYQHDLVMRENRLAQLLLTQQKLKMENPEGFAYQDAQKNAALPIDTPQGRRFIIRDDNSWHVLDDQGNAIGPGRDYLWDAMNDARYPTRLTVETPERSTIEKTAPGEGLKTQTEVPLGVREEEIQSKAGRAYEKLQRKQAKASLQEAVVNERAQKIRDALAEKARLEEQSHIGEGLKKQVPVIHAQEEGKEYGKAGKKYAAQIREGAAKFVEKGKEAAGKTGKGRRGAAPVTGQPGTTTGDRPAPEEAGSTEELSSVSGAGEEPARTLAGKLAARASDKFRIPESSRFATPKDEAAFSVKRPIDYKGSLVDTKQAIKDLNRLATQAQKERAVKTPVTFGGAMKSSALGYLNPFKSMIRIGRINDISTMLHELVHDVFRNAYPEEYTLDALNNPLRQSYASMPDAAREAAKEQAKVFYSRDIGNKPESVQITEGLANFFQHLATGKEVHNGLLQWFNGDFAKEYPAEHQLISKMVDVTHNFYNQTPDDFIKQFRSGKPLKKPWFSIKGKDDLADKLLDQFHALDQFSELSKGNYTGPSPYEINRRHLMSASGLVRNMLYGVGPDNRVTGIHGTIIPGVERPIKEILNEVKDAGKADQFLNYLVAERAAYVYGAHDLASGLSQHDALTYIKNIKDTDPQVESLAREFHKNLYAVMDDIANYSPVTRLWFDALTKHNLDTTGEAHGYYIPFGREGKNAPGFTRSLTGSTRQITDPLSNLDGVLRTFTTRAQYNKTLGTVLERASDPLSATGAYAREVTNDVVLSSLKDEYKQMVDEQLKDSDQSDNALHFAQAGLSLLEPKFTKTRAPEGFKFVAYPMQDGVHFFEVSDRLHEALSPKLPDFGGGPLLNFLIREPRKIFQAGAVLARPAFELPNFARHLVPAWVQAETNNPARYILELIHGIGETALHQLGMKTFTQYANFAERFGDYFSSEIQSELNPEGVRSNIAGWPTKALRTWSDFLSIGEKGLKLTNLILAMKNRGLDPKTFDAWADGADKVDVFAKMTELANIKAKATTDYRIGGKWVNNMNVIVPFFRARATETYQRVKFFQNPQTRPKAIATAMAWAGAGLYYALVNKDERWYKELTIPENMANLFHPMETEDGNLLYHIPLDNLEGTFFGFGQGIMNNAILGGEYSRPIGEYIQGAINLSSPVNLGNRSGLDVLETAAASMTGPLVKPLIELYANKNTYTGRPIVPTGLENVPPEKQFTNSTSESARWIGEQLGWSPVKVQYAIRSAFPVAQDAIKMAEDVLGYKSAKQFGDMKQSLSDWLVSPFLRYGLTKSVLESSTEDFYQQLRKMQLNKNEETPEQKQMRTRLTQVSSGLAAINTMLGANITKEDRDELLDKKRLLLDEAKQIIAGEQGVPIEVTPKAEAKKVREARKAKPPAFQSSANTADEDEE